jgi:hypothetical protein
VISPLGRHKLEDHDFEVSLGYIAQPYLKKTKDMNEMKEWIV